MQLLIFYESSFAFVVILYDLPDDVICNITLYANDTTLIVIHGNSWRLRDFMEWCRKWLVDFNAGKTLNCVVIDEKMDGFLLEVKIIS